VVGQAVAAEAGGKDLKAKGWTTDAQLDSAKAAADEARARLNRAERSVELTKNSLSYDARGRCARRRDRDADRTWPGGCRGPDLDPRRALCREGGRGCDPRNAGRPRQGGGSDRDAVVRARQEI